MNTFLIFALITVIVGAVVADRAISKGKDVTLVLFRFMTLTATTPASERPEPTQAAEPPQGR